MTTSRLNNELSIKETLFVNAFLEGMSVRASMRAAGYSQSNGNHKRLSTDPRIQAAIKNGRRQLIRKSLYTREKAVEMLLDAYHNAQSAAEQVQAVRELNKMHGYEAPKRLEIDAQVSEVRQVKQLENMSVEELAKLAKLGTSLEIEDAELIEGEYEETEYEETEPALIEATH